MPRTLATLLKRGWPFLLAAASIALAITSYNMGEVLEKHHRKLMEEVHYAIAALILFVSFYFIVLLVWTVWTTVHDGDDQ